MENQEILKSSIRELGFAKQLKETSLKEAAVHTMRALTSGHRKAMRLSKRTIARYAAAVIGHVKGRMNLPRSAIDNHRVIKSFIISFVKTHFFDRSGKIQNMKLFKDLFDVDLLDRRVAMSDVKRDMSPSVILKYAIQKKPISSFKNLTKLQAMNNNEIKLVLNPRGRFNPRLNGLDEERALTFAVMLTRKFADGTSNADQRMRLLTLIQQLQKTNKLNKDLFSNIREYV